MGTCLFCLKPMGDANVVSTRFGLVHKQCWTDESFMSRLNKLRRIESEKTRKQAAEIKDGQ